MFSFFKKIKQFGFGGSKYIVKSAQGVCSNEVIAFQNGFIPLGRIQEWIDRDGQVLIQQFIYNPQKYIWRIDIVSSEIIVANRRYCYNKDDALPICNGTHGGSIEFIDTNNVPTEIKGIALASVKALELDVAGVDIIINDRNIPFLLEVNPEPDITLDRYEFPHAIANLLINKARIE